MNPTDPELKVVDNIGLPEGVIPWLRSRISQGSIEHEERFRLCIACGKPHWAGGHLKKPPTIVFQPEEPGWEATVCKSCAEFGERFPDVYSQMLDMFTWYAAKNGGK